MTTKKKPHHTTTKKKVHVDAYKVPAHTRSLPKHHKGHGGKKK